MEPVLLVDDDPSARACLREFLELKGYHCIEADHGEAALEKIAKEGVSIVVTDAVAVTAALAEISPNIAIVETEGQSFEYDVLPEINHGDTGLDTVEITTPAAYGNPTVTGVRVGGTDLASACPAQSITEYCAVVEGNTVTV